MKKTLTLTIFGLLSFSALGQSKIPSKIDLLKIQDIQIEVSEEIDNGYTCSEYENMGGYAIESRQFEGKCPTGDLKEIYGRKWARHHYLSENHHRSKLATPVIVLKDGSEIRLETIEFKRSKERADQEEWGELPWGYKNPLHDWLQSAKGVMADAGNVYNVYATNPCYRNALSTQIVRDERAGGTIYKAKTESQIVDCKSVSADSIIVIKN